MAGNEWLIAKAAKAFNKVRRRFTDSSVEVLLMKPSETEREYDVVWQTVDNWFFDTQKGELYLAETALNLEVPMSEATHVQVGEKVFVMTPDDVTPPDELGGPRVYWTIRAEQFPRREQYRNIY